MKQRHARHKHSTWKAYRRKMILERLYEAVIDSAMNGGNRIGFVRLLSMAPEQRAAARAQQEKEQQEFDRKRAEERAHRPSLTRFK